MNPLVSIALPVYNGARFLAEAIQSILDQTYTHFELIIVDDCSTDNSIKIIESFKDSRIIFVKNETNRRTSYCLNRTLELTKGKYWARMDQDDISLPERIAEQVKFMEANPETGICGTQFKTFGENIQPDISGYPSDHQAIELMQLYVSPFAHPTVMIRKDVLDRYNLRYVESIIAEDYSLWARLLPVTVAYNLPSVLLHYRRHPESITKTFFKVIGKERKIIQRDYCRKLFKLSSNLIPDLVYSNNPVTRKIGLMLLKKKNNKYPDVLMNEYSQKLNDYFWQRNIVKYYFNRIKEILKIK